MLDLHFEATVTLVCINVLMAVAMWFPLAAGQISVMATGSIAVGAYAGGWLSTTHDASLLPMVLAGAVAGCLFSFPMGFLSQRFKGFTLAVVTIGFAESARLLLSRIDQFGGILGMPGIGSREVFDAVYPTSIALAVLTLVAVYLIMRSPTGRFVDVLAVDELQARSLGVPTITTKVLVFAFSGAAAGMGGALFAAYTGFIEPNQFSLLLTIEIFAYVTVGGVGSFAGPAVGATVLTVALQWLEFAGTTRNLFFGGIVIVAVLVRQQGMATRSRRLRRRRVDRWVEGAAPPAALPAPSTPA